MHGPGQKKVRLGDETAGLSALLHLPAFQTSSNISHSYKGIFMRRAAFLPSLALFALFLAVFQQGCGVKQTVVQQEPSESAPNADQIEQEVESQLNQIGQSQKTGDFEPPMVVGLAENDELVRGLSLKFRVNNPTHDLTVDQAAYLETLLNGNSAAIGDALQRRDAWVQAFEGDWSYDFNSTGDRLLFITVLQFNLKDQENVLRNAVQAGNVSPDQALLGKQRIQSVRDAEISDFSQNNALDLSSDEILELQQMSDDSGRFIRMLNQQTGGAFAQAPAPGGGGDFTAQTSSDFPSPGSYSAPAPSQSHPYWNSRSPNSGYKSAVAGSTPVASPPPATPTATPVPPPTPTPTPLPPTPTAENSSDSPSPTEALLPSDSLKARDQRLHQVFESAQKQGKGTKEEWASAKQLRHDFHQALKNFLQQNQQQGLTQDQMDQLSGMLDDYEKSISGLSSPTPVPTNEK